MMYMIFTALSNLVFLIAGAKLYQAGEKDRNIKLSNIPNIPITKKYGDEPAVAPEDEDEEGDF